jgi:nitroreductase
MPDVSGLDQFLGHRSVRDYSDRAVPRELVAGLIGTASSAATSSHLALWSVVSVQDPDRRASIARLCADQKQVHLAPWFFAFCADLHRIGVVAESVGDSPAALSTAEFYTMAVVDAALAAERMVCAAESLGLASCYIGALRNDAFGVREILGLPPRTFGLFGLCLGWPAEDSGASIKPRLGLDSVWFEERYDLGRGIGDFDVRMSEFYKSQGQDSSVTWSQRSGRRVNGSQMSGREAVGPFLLDQGLSLE